MESGAIHTSRRAQSQPRWWQMMIRMLSRPRFLIGALVPVLIFYVLQRAGQPLTGAVLAGLWGLGAALAGYARERRWNVFGMLAATAAAISIITTLVSRSEAFYLASDAIGDVLGGVVFLGSLLLPRSLLQIIVEEAGVVGRFPEGFAQTPLYRRTWQIVTRVWGGAYLFKAALLLLAQFGLLAASLISLETFLAIRTVSGWVFSIAAMAFSFWFPGWYWRRQ